MNDKDNLSCTPLCLLGTLFEDAAVDKLYSLLQDTRPLKHGTWVVGVSGWLLYVPG